MKEIWIALGIILISVGICVFFSLKASPAGTDHKVEWTPTTYSDKETGCQYFYSNGMLFPRLNAEGVPMCNCT